MLQRPGSGSSCSPETPTIVPVSKRLSRDLAMNLLTRRLSNLLAGDIREILGTEVLGEAWLRLSSCARSICSDGRDVDTRDAA